MCFQCIHDRETGKPSLTWCFIKPSSLPVLHSSWRYKLSCEKFRSEMEWFSFKMLTNSIKFSHLLLPYTGEHKVGHWPEFMYNTRLDWKKRRPIELNLSWNFIFFPSFSWGSFSSSGCRGIPTQLLLSLHFFSQVHLCDFPLCEIMCRRNRDPCFPLTLAVINISVLCATWAAWMWRWQLPRVAVDHHCLCGVTQISAALTLLWIWCNLLQQNEGGCRKWDSEKKSKAELCWASILD